MNMDKQQTRRRIGARIAELRREKRLTQYELGDRTGLNQSHIARIEAGKYSAGCDTLQTIAQAMGYKLDFVKMKRNEINI